MVKIGRWLQYLIIVTVITEIIVKMIVMLMNKDNNT